MKNTDEILRSLVPHLRGFGCVVHRCPGYLNLDFPRNVWVRIHVVPVGDSARLDVGDAKHERPLATANLGRIDEFDDDAARFTSGWLVIRSKHWLWRYEQELRAAAASNGE